jgi:hypothetical protein
MQKQHPFAKRQQIVVRILYAALISTLAIGSAGQTYSVRAASAATELRYSLSAKKLKGNNATICVGDDVPIHVRVTRAEFDGDQGSNAQEITGARIEASMSNGGIGRLNPISIHTGWDSNDPGGADYKFHAERVGTTTIFFKGTINHVWWPAKLGLFPLVDRKDFVKDQVEITVEECQYKVTTISKWQVSGEANIKIEAWINGAGLMDDGTGHYTGTANVTWQLTASQVVDCKAQSVTTTSEATLNGERDDDQLIVDIDFLTANILLPAFCMADGDIASGSTPVQMTPDPVTFTVPASGGGERQPHVLQGPESVSGFIVVIVTQANQH